MFMSRLRASSLLKLSFVSSIILNQTCMTKSHRVGPRLEPYRHPFVIVFVTGSLVIACLSWIPRKVRGAPSAPLHFPFVPQHMVSMSYWRRSVGPVLVVVFVCPYFLYKFIYRFYCRYSFSKSDIGPVIKRNKFSIDIRRDPRTLSKRKTAKWMTATTSLSKYASSTAITIIMCALRATSLGHSKLP